MEDKVSLKEFLIQKIEYEKKLVELQHKLTEKALELQKQENDKHFLLLNGEYVRIDKVLAASVPREVFELFKKEMDIKIVELKEKGSEVLGKGKGISIGQGTIFAILGAISVIVTVILNIRG